MTEEERAAYRAFVREHHPDRGGDPDEFIAGLARLRAQHRQHLRQPEPPPPDDDPRFDAPIEVVTPLPFPVRVGVALIRTWQRRHNPRVE